MLRAESKFTRNEKTNTFSGTYTFKGKSYKANDIPRLAADMYLDECARKGSTPAYNTFKDHPNYYKLLADFGLYDSRGRYAPHSKVAFRLPSTVPYLDANGIRASESTEAFIKRELGKELAVRDEIATALADRSEGAIIPEYIRRVNALSSMGDVSFSLEDVAPVMPSSDGWSRTHTTAEAKKIYPTVVDGKDILLKIAIKKSPQKNKFWVHSIYTIENANGSPASTNGGTEAGHITAGIEVIIPDSAEKNNPSDENSSKKSSTDTESSTTGGDFSFSLEDADGHRADAVEAFGTTNDFKVAGFVLPDGRMLNMGTLRASQRHLSISKVLPNVAKEDAIATFLREGNVRIAADSPGIEISADARPTTSQLNVLSRFVSASRNKGRFYVDFTAANGNEIGSLSYYGGEVNAEIIVGDIKRYYDTGRLPANNDISFSLEDNDADYAAIIEKGAPIAAPDMTVGQMLKRVANNTHYKVFSKRKILDVVKSFAGMEFLKAKDVEAFADTIWQNFNALGDGDSVQLIIGFHDKTNDGTKRYKGARYAKNYNGENETILKNGKTEHVAFNKFVLRAESKFTQNEKTNTFSGTYTFKGKTYKANDIPRLAADMYLDECARKGSTPAYNTFKEHPNYYKLLADFGLYDSRGRYAPHSKVAFRLPSTVPYLDANGIRASESTEAFIERELAKELTVRDEIATALADRSEGAIIPEYIRRVNALSSMGDVSFSLEDTETEESTVTNDADGIDIYTEEQYNRFGWARHSEALTKNELDDLYSKLQEKKNLRRFPRSARGEAIVEVNDMPHTTLGVDNVFVFVKGTPTEPDITKVLRVSLFNETDMQKVRKYIYAREKTGSHKRASRFDGGALWEDGLVNDYSRQDFPSYQAYRTELRKRGVRSSSQENTDAHRIEYERGGNSRSIRDDVSFSLEDADGHRADAVEAFGTTNDFKVAGFVLPDGRMLNMGTLRASQRHLSISKVLPNVAKEDAVPTFLREGNVRIAADSPGIEMSADARPTTSQLNVLSRFISASRNKGRFYVDFTAANGNEIGSLSYYGSDVNSETIINDLKRYYDTGRLPANNDISFSLEDNDADYAAIIEKGAPIAAPDMTVGQMLKRVANNTHYKVFSKGKILKVVKSFAGMEFLKAKDVEAFADTIWQNFNALGDGESVQEFAHDMARYIFVRVALDGNVKKEVSIEAKERLVALSTYLIDNNLQAGLFEFCRDYVARELENSRMYVLATVGFTYEEYVRRWMNADEKTICECADLTEAQKAVLIKANRIKPIQLSPEQIVRKGRNDGRRAPLGASPRKKKKIQFGVKFLTTLLLSGGIAIIALDFIVEPTWTIFATVTLKLLTVVVNGFNGYKYGYKNIVIDTVEYVTDQTDILEQAIKFIENRNFFEPPENFSYREKEIVPQESPH